MLQKPAAHLESNHKNIKISTQKKFICQREVLGIHHANAHRNTHLHQTCSSKIEGDKIGDTERTPALEFDVIQK